MTVEELDIVVQASVEGALKEFNKLVPSIKQVTKQMAEQINKSDLSGFTGKVQQAVKQVKRKLEGLKSLNKTNNLEIKVTTEDAKKQITQLQKQIDSLKSKINARQIKLSAITPQLDKITNQTIREVTPNGVSSNNPAIQKNIDGSLSRNQDYTKLSAQESKLTSEIFEYNRQLSEANSKLKQLKQQINQTSTSQSRLTSFFNAFKNKISEAKTSSNQLKQSFNQLPNITAKISGNIKHIGKGMKQGLGNVLRYAGALFSLRGIYSVLSNSAQAWLSSQDAGAQQLSANIEYMKYAMGSALAPVIQFVTNLVYQLMKAIQSVAYALTGVNIFAKASSKSYASMAGSAKKAKNETKQLLGVHNEINNIQNTDSLDSGSGGGATPSFDLSQMDNTSSSIIDAIKNGDWHQVGVTIGEKLNNAMNSIPWDKIQNTARNIGTGIAKLLNGFIATTDWNQVGNTFAQGLNTIIYLGYSFVTTFDWKQFGKAIGDTINGFFKNIDWATIGTTLSEGIKGIFDTVGSFFETFDWSFIVDGLIDFIVNIDWNGVSDSIFRALGSACGSLVNLGMVIGEYLGQACQNLGSFFADKVRECGGDVVLGILKGIIEGFIGIGVWIYDHMIYPLIEGFCSALGIHSPSTVFEEFGKNIVQGLFNGIQSLVNTISQIWYNIKETAITIFNSIRDNVSNVFNNLKNTTSNIWNNITSSITNAVNNIKNRMVDSFRTAYNGVTNIFSRIGSFFSGVWNSVRSTFSALGTNIGNAISGAVKSGINGVISMIQNTINRAIELINGGINLINKIPGVYVGHIGYLSLPRLAKGGVLTQPTAVLAGEYSGAKSNPEIVTPQNIMYDTMRRALSDSDIGSNDDRPIYLTVNVGNTKLGQILLEDLRNMKRRTGNGIEALVGG